MDSSRCWRSRALKGGPRLLLLDEPSLGLAPVIVNQVFAALRDLKESGLTILPVEQNARQVLKASDRAYVLEQGRGAVEGTLFPASFVAGASAAASDFAAAYEERFGNAPDHWAATGHPMMRIVASALSGIEGEVTREALRVALAASTDVPVVLGSGLMSFDGNRVPHVGGIVMKIEDGGWAMP